MHNKAANYVIHDKLINSVKQKQLSRVEQGWEQRVTCFSIKKDQQGKHH
jgi:hypothetical protein